MSVLMPVLLPHVFDKDHEVMSPSRNAEFSGGLGFKRTFILHCFFESGGMASHGHRMDKSTKHTSSSPLRGLRALSVPSWQHRCLHLGFL